MTYMVKGTVVGAQGEVVMGVASFSLSSVPVVAVIVSSSGSLMLLSGLFAVHDVRGRRLRGGCVVCRERARSRLGQLPSAGSSNSSGDDSGSGSCKSSRFSFNIFM